MISRRVFLKNGAFALVSLGFAPSFLARTAFAAGDAPGRAAHRDLSARRRRWPEHGRPVRRGRLLSRPPEHRHSPPERRRGKRARSRRLLRLQSAARPAQAALGSPRPGDRSCVRLARLDPLALRRAGLHGDGDAGRQEHRGRLAEPLSPGAADRRHDGVSRGRARPAAAACAAGHRAGPRHQSDLAVRHPGGETARRSAHRSKRSTRPRPIAC